MTNPTSELETFRLRPSRFSDPTLLCRRLEELKDDCDAIAQSLSPADRATLEEYLTLLQDHEDWQTMNAYQSGIQIGIRRQQEKSR